MLVNLDCVVDVVTDFLLTSYSVVAGKSSSKAEVDSETSSMRSAVHGSIVSSSSDEVLGPSVSSWMENVVLGTGVPRLRAVVYLQGVEVLLGLEVKM